MGCLWDSSVVVVPVREGEDLTATRGRGGERLERDEEGRGREGEKFGGRQGGKEGERGEEIESRGVGMLAASR